ncbi:hypothetical protein AB0G95_38290 [Streptomyces virginiae]|uniref:hypothetical protein n=1 Tax=Streptomyces TaxID=1883 RepID=UPI003426C42F
MEAGDMAGWLGGIAGIAAVAYAHQANKQARKANTTATEANTLAKEANTYARRSDARSIERDDVRWEGDWSAPGRYELVQRGEATAHEVVATVTVDDEERTIRKPHVAKGQILVFDFPVAASVLAEERRRLQQARAEDAANSGMASMLPRADPMRLGLYSHSISERVDWATPNGTHKVHDYSSPPFTTLGPHD